MKGSNIFILEIDNCILGYLKYNKAQYNIHRFINNIHRHKKYNIEINLLRPGVIEFVQFIKKKYNAEIYIYSYSEPCWINDIVVPNIQKHFAINKPYFTNADIINNNFPLDTISKNIFYPKYKKINNITFISAYNATNQLNNRQLIIPEYNNIEYIDLYEKIIQHYGKNIFDNKEIKAFFYNIENKLSNVYLADHTDEIYLRLKKILNMRYVELNNVNNDTFFLSLIEKLTDLSDKTIKRLSL